MPDKQEWIMIAWTVGVVAVLIVISQLLFQGQPDNPAEEAAEAVIEMQTGIQIDLSPDSPE